MPVSLAVVGSINVDLTARTARLPEPGETIGGGRLVREAGGKGANQAVAAARSSASVAGRLTTAWKRSAYFGCSVPIHLSHQVK